MRVMVSFDNRIRPDSTGVYFLNAFRALGHKVDHVLPENTWFVAGGYDLYVKIDDGLKNTKWNHNLHPSIYYCIDTHIETDWRLNLAKSGTFDHIAVCHSQGLSLAWPKPAEWIPVGCDPDVHYWGHTEKIYDVCFIGNLHNGLAQKRIDAIDAAFSRAKSIFCAPRTFREMAEKYAQSRIVLNCSINGDCNMRVFEALCSGSCLVTDRVEDLAGVGLIENGHYVGYSTTDELKEKVSMLLEQAPYRERIAQKGREEAIRNHTYKKRVETMLEKFNLNEKEKVNV